MFFKVSLILILVSIQCEGQTSIEGNWLTTDTRISNNQLFEFKQDSVKSEFLRDWRTYEINGKNLYIHCVGYTAAKNAYTSIYEIALLSKDSLIISPINDFAIHEETTLNRLRKKPSRIKFFRRELTFQMIGFDSISYTSKQGPFYLQSYYSPRTELIVTLHASGFVRYEFETIDTLKLNHQGNRKRIKWADKEKSSEHLVGKLGSENMLKFRDLLDRSNIQNIDIEKDFGDYKRRLHANPTTLTVYWKGQNVYELISTDYPWTLSPLISFLKDMPHYIARN
jgi:hypothetical protein